MKNDDLIQNLVNDLEPVKPLSPTSVRFLIVLTGSFAALFAYIFLVHGGLRPDISLKLGKSPAFTAEIVTLLLAALTTGFAAVKLSLPNDELALSTRLMVVFGLAMWAVTIFGHMIGVTPEIWAHSFAEHSQPHHCFLDTVAASVIPTAITLHVMRQAAATHTFWAGFATMLFTLTLAALSVRIVCQIDDFIHLFFWHFTPVALLSILGLLAGRHVLKW